MWDSTTFFLHRKRLLVLGCFLFFLFNLLILQFYKIQIIEGKKWAKIAKGQHQIILYEPFMRGSFYANSSVKGGHVAKEQILVMDVPRFHLFIDPKAIPEEKKPDIYQKLFQFFPLSEIEKSQIRQNFYKKSRCRKLLKWADNQKKEEFLSWWERYAKKEKIAKNALYFRLDYKRSYPFKSLLGQVLHTVQEEKEEKTFQGLPTGGLELAYNPYLKGQLGKRICYRSPRHPLEMGPILAFPENGADIHLTVNHYLQAICEEELQKGVIEAEAKGGWLLMMDPFTGEILASAQYPFFDPESYRNYYNQKEELEHTRIKAVSDAFEPGSTFKPIAMAVCLQGNLLYEKKYQQKLFNPEEKVEVKSGSFPKTRFQLKDGRPRKYMNLSMALQKSGNIYPGKIVQRVIENLGEKWYREAFVEIFGFGKKTGIDLPGESLGNVPKPGRLHTNKKPEWSVPTPYSIAIGHNILVTSIQLLSAYATIANGGYKVIPTIVRKIVKKTGGKTQILYENTEKSRRQERVLSEEVIHELVKGMLLVTEPGGSSPRGNLLEYAVAGKSGTSEKIIEGKYSHEKYLCNFAGFTPVEKPKFVILVILDEPKKKFIPGIGKNYLGGISASPIFKRVAQRSLEYLGVPPNREEKEKQKEWAKQVRKLYDKWNEIKKSY